MIPWNDHIFPIHVPLSPLIEKLNPRPLRDKFLLVQRCLFLILLLLINSPPFSGPHKGHAHSMIDMGPINQPDSQSVSHWNSAAFQFWPQRGGPSDVMKVVGGVNRKLLSFLAKHISVTDLATTTAQQTNESLDCPRVSTEQRI